MAKFRSIGWAAAQDPIYGVDHDNIEPELTVENWEDKAIVRSGLYIWVTEGRFRNDEGGEESCYSVQIYSDQQGRDREKDFACLDEALAYANLLGDAEGEWPDERGSTAYITMFPGFGFGPVTIDVTSEKETSSDNDLN